MLSCLEESFRIDSAIYKGIPFLASHYMPSFSNITLSKFVMLHTFVLFFLLSAFFSLLFKIIYIARRLKKGKNQIKDKQPYWHIVIHSC